MKSRGLPGSYAYILKVALQAVQVVTEAGNVRADAGVATGTIAVGTGGRGGCGENGGAAEIGADCNRLPFNSSWISCPPAGSPNCVAKSWTSATSPGFMR